MLQIAQVVGAVLVLIPFAWSQLGRLGTASMLYLALNFLGSGVLAVLALHERQWGFLLLEGIWAMVAAWGLVRGSLEPMPGATESAPAITPAGISLAATSVATSRPSITSIPSSNPDDLHAMDA